MASSFGTVDPAALIAIAGMAVATYATRISGYWLFRRLSLGGRTKAALEAVPGAVLTAVIAPSVLATGPAEWIAAIVTLATARKVPVIIAIACGVLTVAILRRWMA
jgi:uncharacterized membrane protein